VPKIQTNIAIRSLMAPQIILIISLLLHKTSSLPSWY